MSFCLMCSLSLKTFSQENPPDSQNSYDVKYELDYIKGVPDQSQIRPLSIKLENNQVNLSPFFQRANTLLNQSDTNNTYFIERGLDSILNATYKLCEQNLSTSSQIDNCKNNAEITIETQRTQMLEQQSSKVLFPRRYKEQVTIPTQMEVDERVERIRDYYINRGGCRVSYCSNNEVFDTLLYGSPSHYNQVLDILKEAGATNNCFKSIFKEMIEGYWHDPFKNMPTTCQGLRGSDQRVCNQMQSDFRRVTQRMEDMIKAIQPQENNTPISLSCSSSNDLIRNLGSVLSEIENRSCENYSVGEARYPQHQGSISGTYHIKKESNGDYTVTIPMIFAPADDYDGDVPEDQIQSHYLQKAQGCMDEASPNMLGPNGERLHFEITDGNLNNSCERPNEISIQSLGARSHSESYAADISCPSNVHEISHITGLADEYQERHTGTHIHVMTGDIHEGTASTTELFRLHYNCRVIQDNSLMGTHWQRFESVERGEEDSLLDPTHFHVILYGNNCPSRDDIQLYQQCASLAYTTMYKANSLEHNCPSEKQQCEDSNVLGRDLDKEIARLEAQLKRHLDWISRNNHRRFSGFLRDESLSSILRGIQEKLRVSPDISHTELLNSQELTEIKNTLDAPLYNGFDMFLDKRQRELNQIRAIRNRLRHLRSQQ